MKRKIDDAKLLEFFRSGTPQVTIAAEFQCSPAAICKRLKRLLPQPAEVLDRHDLTAQQKRFVIAKAAGRTHTQAAMSSYEVSSLASAKAIGSELMAKPEIQVAIADLMEHKGIGREYRVTRLGQHMEHPDPIVSLKALDMGFKLDGYQDREATPPVTNINIVVHRHDGTTVVLEGLNRPTDEKYRPEVEASPFRSDPDTPPPQEAHREG